MSVSVGLMGGIFRRSVLVNKAMGYLIGCGVFVVLMVLGAYIRIPLYFTPVPITLQTLFVLLSGAILGRRWGTYSQLTYLFLGSCGLPIFQGYGAGLAHVFGPTGGYLIGFVFAAYLVGYLLSQYKGSGMFKVFTTMALGLLVIYTCGVTWLKLILGIKVSQALILGFYPFLPGAAIKLIAASSIYMGLKSKF